MSTCKWSCFQGGRIPATGHWFARTESQQRKKAQNGGVGTFWKRSAIQHREGKAILDVSRRGKAQEGMVKLSLTSPLLGVMSNPVLKRLLRNTVSIAPGTKASKHRGLSLPHSSESSRMKPRFQSCLRQRVENQSLELEDTKTMGSSAYRSIIIPSKVNTDIWVQRCPKPFSLRSSALKIWGMNILPTGTVTEKKKIIPSHRNMKCIYLSVLFLLQFYKIKGYSSCSDSYTSEFKRSLRHEDGGEDKGGVFFFVH